MALDSICWNCQNAVQQPRSPVTCYRKEEILTSFFSMFRKRVKYIYVLIELWMEQCFSLKCALYAERTIGMLTALVFNITLQEKKIF